MDRRNFMSLLGMAGAVPVLPAVRAVAADAGPAHAAGPAPVQTESRAAFGELLDLLHQADLRYLGPEHRIVQPLDIADGHRALLHLLSAGLELVAEADPERPAFRRMVSPTRKFRGDNPDAIYFSTPIRPDRTYRIRGNVAGAVYTSISFEIGGADGSLPTGVARAINDRELQIAADGSYELLFGPEPRGGNWFKLDPGIGSITTRHYFETQTCIAADPTKLIPISIECLDPVAPKPAPTDSSIAHGIRRLTNWVRGMTVDDVPPKTIPSWVSTVPNRFNPPALPDGSIGFANRDAHYAMAPYVLKPDEALVIEGRFPKCRFANLVLWNRFMQTYDYETHRVSLNRTQTKLQPDGSFRMVLAHTNPGLPNWLDTQGRTSGLLYWRFIFPEEPIQPLATKLVLLASLSGAGLRP